MSNTNKSKYIELWQRYLPRIIQVLPDCDKNTHHLLLNSYEFQLTGNMKNYSFNLEFIDGKVSNNISGSAVAKDLAAVIEGSSEVIQIISSGHYKFRMDKKFSLCICKQEHSAEMKLEFS
jgi:hypothetical protein